MDYVTINFKKVKVEVVVNGRLIFSLMDERQRAFDYLWKRLYNIEVDHPGIKDDDIQIRLEFIQ